jgi:hypothetical protein
MYTYFGVLIAMFVKPKTEIVRGGQCQIFHCRCLGLRRPLYYKQYSPLTNYVRSLRYSVKHETSIGIGVSELSVLNFFFYYYS